MGFLVNPIKILELLRSMGLDISQETKEQLRDMGYKLPEDEETKNGTD